MKKLVSSALLALTVSGFAAVPSFAGCCFGLFPHSCCGCCCKVCCRQYNAFSPFCCDCCCPSGGGCGAGMCGDCGPCGDGMCGDGMCGDGMCPGGGCGLNYSGVPSCPSGGCGGGDGACLGSLPACDPAAPAAPGAATPPASNPVAGPSPLPGSMPVGPTSQAVGYRGIQNTSYRPAIPPSSNTVTPVRMRPQMMTAPSYWDN